MSARKIPPRDAPVQRPPIRRHTGSTVRQLRDPQGNIDRPIGVQAGGDPAARSRSQRRPPDRSTHFVPHIKLPSITAIPKPPLEWTSALLSVPVDQSVTSVYPGGGAAELLNPNPQTRQVAAQLGVRPQFASLHPADRSASIPVPRQPPVAFEKIGNEAFFVRPRYSDCRFLGEGGFGVVVSATDNQGNRQQRVAIKKISGFRNDPQFLLLTLREVRIMAHLCHENIITLLDLIVNDQTRDKLNEIYLVMHLMDTNLHLLLQSQPLAPATIKNYFYQLMRGLAYLHSANVMHRDIKPENLLIDEGDGILKISDFTLTRVYDPDADRSNNLLTKDVVSLWWRAPEIIYCPGLYSNSVDVWSAGCILAEMMTRYPLFRGRNKLEQIQIIYGTLGAQPHHILSAVIDQECFQLLHSPDVGTPVKVRWQDMFPTASADCLNLLDRMLTFEPSSRITARNALKHRFLEDIADPDEHYLSRTPFTHIDEELDNEPFDELKEQLLQEVKLFRDKQQRQRDGARTQASTHVAALSHVQALSLKDD